MAAFKYPLKHGWVPSVGGRDEGKIISIRNASWNSDHTLVESSCCFTLFADPCQRARTQLLCACLCVCEADYFGFLLFTHSCHVCVTSLCHHNIRCVGASRNHEWQQQKSRFKPVSSFVHLQDVVIMTSASLVCNDSTWLTFKQKWLCFRRQNKWHQCFEICFIWKRTL